MDRADGSIPSIKGGGIKVGSISNACPCQQSAIEVGNINKYISYINISHFISVQQHIRFPVNEIDKLVSIKHLKFYMFYIIIIVFIFFHRIFC